MPQPFRWKPILFSALVLPGIGQLYQRRWKTGAGLLALFVGSAFYVMLQWTAWYQHILMTLEKQNLPTDPDRLIQWVTDQVGKIGVDPMVQVAQWLLLACWLLSIIDAWWYEKHKPDTIRL